MLFDTYRYHAVFPDTPMTMVQAESQHRGHAIIEQVHADLRAGALAHLPSGHFQANAAPSSEPKTGGARGPSCPQQPCSSDSPHESADDHHA